MLKREHLPTRKTTSGGLAGGLTIITIWALKQFWGIEVTNEVAQGFTLVFTSLVYYVTPEAA
jgi:hypothetical protein